jgi:phosphoglycolate phosphatase
MTRTSAAGIEIAMPYSLAIFDLDGTLADSFPWFLRHVNGIADRFGFRRIVEGDILAEAGNGMPALSALGHELRSAGSREILKMLDVPLWKLPMLARHMRRLKAAHIGDIALFPGAGEMLRTLADGGIRLALVTSDSEANARRQLGDANAALFSDFACGASLFGKAAKFRGVLRRAGIPARHAIAIGDEVRDIEAARAAGVACAAVTWGYAAPAALRAHGPDMVFEAMGDIAARLIPARSSH